MQLKIFENPEKLPEDFKNIFWDCDFSHLNWSEYPYFITERILKYGDIPMLKWLFDRIDKEYVKEVIKTSKQLDERTINYWKVMLSGE